MALNISSVSFDVPKYNTDKVIGIYSGSTTVSAESGGTPGSAQINISTNILDTTLFLGIYKIDSSSQYQDIGTTFYVGGNLDSGISTNCVSTPGTLTIYISNFDMNSHTINCDIALLAKSNQSLITPQPVNYNTYFGSSFNYLKIFADEVKSITIPAGTATSASQYTLSVNHNLGYNPVTRIFGEKNNQLVGSDYIWTLNGGPLSLQTIISSTDINYIFINQTSAVTLDAHYRIYYDAN